MKPGPYTPPRSAVRDAPSLPEGSRLMRLGRNLLLIGSAMVIAVCVIAGIATLRNGRDHLKAGQEKEGF